MEDKIRQLEVFSLIDEAVGGNNSALETLLTDVQDLIFNLSLRMLGSIQDAEDATQEILIRLITNLSAFRKECAFTTWVFAISTNYLKNYKKSMFAKYPLSFEYYKEDILKGQGGNITDSSQEVDKNILSDELKLSCTNVMLQCLEPENRCIFILGTMFKLDSRIAGEVLNINPDTYRQRLSRTRKKMAHFLGEYCGLNGGACSCKKRINYAITNKRLNPQNLEYSPLCKRDNPIILDYKAAMEQIDDIAMVFNNLPVYRTSQEARKFITTLLQTDIFQNIQYKEKNDAT